jgi:hypothetical protein
MILAELDAALETRRIDPQAYSLNGVGEFPSETYVIRFCQSGVVGRDGYWQTYYSERGRKSGLMQFDSEEDACRHFLSWISSDQSTRLR